MQHEALRTGSSERINWWSGSADALIAAGVAELHEFPGQPARNTCVVTIRPIAGLQGARQWAAAPGYRRIARSGAGFRVEITVSLEERQRREDAQANRQSSFDTDYARAIAAWESRPFSAASERISGVVIVNTGNSWETTSGSREQLIAAGRCDSDHFPEGKKRLRFCEGPHHIWHIEKEPGRDVYDFHETLSFAGRAARMAARAAFEAEGHLTADRPRLSRRPTLRLVWSSPGCATSGESGGLRS